MNNTIGPYFNTYLTTNIVLRANQLNNKLYNNLKENLRNKLQGKCYRNYGYIVKIYQIEEKSEGVIIPEDTTASVSYKIKFSCKLCKPLKNSFITCEVVSINKSIVYLRNGPMYMLILDGFINTDNFTYDDKRNVLLAYKDNDKSKGIPIVQGSYIIAKVTGSQIEDKSKRILLIGTLEKIASENDIKQIIEMREKDSKEFINMEDYDENKLNKNIIKTEEIEETEETESEAETETED
jgi:DNA-directed RNA polymerase subunit E'/Rpb7